MKKFIAGLLIAMVILTASMPVAFAEKKNDNGNNGKKPEKTENSAKNDNGKKEDAHSKNYERKMQMLNARADFEERKLAREQLRKQRKEELKLQQQLVKQYKQELKALLLELEGMSEEELAEYGDAVAADIEALKLQIRDAQKYKLEIGEAIREQIRVIFPGMMPKGPPTEEEVEEIEEVIEEL